MVPRRSDKDWAGVRPECSAANAIISLCLKESAFSPLKTLNDQNLNAGQRLESLNFKCAIRSAEHVSIPSISDCERPVTDDLSKVTYGRSVEPGERRAFY